MFRPRSLVLALGCLFLICSTAGAQGELPGEWPQWRGPRRDGISNDKGLLKSWPKEGPPVAWTVDTVGTGYSSIALKDGRIYTQGDLEGVEHVICLRASDGQLLWAVQPQPVAEALKARVDQEFAKFDTNQDGVVDEAEALRRLGWNFNRYDRPNEDDPDAGKLASARGVALFAELDADKDGSLSWKEAGSLLRDAFGKIDQKDDDAEPRPLARQRAAALLKELDADKDGFLQFEEARRSALDSGFRQADQPAAGEQKGDGKLTPLEIEEYLVRREAGRDGQLSQQELITYYEKNHPGADGQLSRAELRRYYGGYRNGQGDGPRATPTVDGDRLYVEGGQGDLSCLEAATGKTLWHVNLTDTELGGRVPGWGYCESPLVVGDHLIVTPGGKQGTVAALDKQTGKIVWRSEDVVQAAHYASPVVGRIGGTLQIVQFARESVFGLDRDSGKLMWQYSNANNGTANCATPLIYKDHVFASSSYGTGGGLARISAKGGGQEAEEVYFEKRMANHHGGIVRVGDYMYGFGSGGLICMHFLTGEVAWRERSVGKGSLCVADGMLYLLGERYDVALAEATPEAYREHGRFKITGLGRPSWAHPIVAGGKFYIRNQHSLTAYDVTP